MKSVADSFRAASAARSARLTPEQRLELALRLGRLYLRWYASAHGVELAEARRILARGRRRGRLHSPAIEALEA